MLGLSMAAIAGMVGTGGLGGDVNEAIGQLNVGLGSEAGVAIVILAIYLDRMTSALGTQVSPLGRRAAAKAARRAGPARSGPTAPARRRRDRRRRPRARRGRHGRLRRHLRQTTAASAARTSARARRSASATSPGTRASPPPSSGRRSWRSAATRSTTKQFDAGPALHLASPAATSTSRPTPGCPPPTPQYWKKYGKQARRPRLLVRPDVPGAERPVVHEGHRLPGGPQGQGRRVRREDHRHRVRAPE